MLDDLTTRDQRMLFAVVTLVHLANSKEELDADTETLQSAARKHLCQLATLTTEALAVLMPFKAQEVRDRGGVYYGQNVISKNLIIANRKELLNGNGFVLGVSGSGWITGRSVRKDSFGITAPRNARRTMAAKRSRAAPSAALPSPAAAWRRF